MQVLFVTVVHDKISTVSRILFIAAENNYQIEFIMGTVLNLISFPWEKLSEWGHERYYHWKALGVQILFTASILDLFVPNGPARSLHCGYCCVNKNCKKCYGLSQQWGKWPI